MQVPSERSFERVPSGLNGHKRVPSDLTVLSGYI